MLKKTAEAVANELSAPRLSRICKLIDDCSRSNEVERLSTIFSSYL